jgi:hypothetical protein
MAHNAPDSMNIARTMPRENVAVKDSLTDLVDAYDALAALSPTGCRADARLTAGSTLAFLETFRRIAWHQPR